ncbi:hypothetical protein V5O48_004413 [Marasmius crinis-equi]|uniref:Uncharacterized protein n=1 Tax=Marasmius crinis-equi TaxID=585013 RepID=A0ABR3FQ77_9AGAR
MGNCAVDSPALLFSSSSNAWSQLRRLNRPPTFIDLTVDPIPSVKISLDIIDYLAHQLRSPGSPSWSETLRQVKIHWKTYLYPWVKLLIEKFILSENEPATLLGRSAIERAMKAIPVLFPLRVPPGVLANWSPLPSYTSTPDLQPLIARVWCDAIEGSHSTWGLWSIALMTMSLVFPDSGLSSKPENQCISGLAVLRHITRFTQRLDNYEVYPEELEYFLTSFKLAREYAPMEMTSSDSADEQSRRTVPATERLQAFVRLSSTLLHKRKRIRDGVRLDSSLCRPMAHAVVIEVMTCCSDAMVIEHGIAEALEAGILTAILKADRLYFSQDFDEERLLRHPEENFLHISVSIIDNISKFLVYPPVLHLLMRNLRAIPDLDRWETELKLKSLESWRHWQEMKEKAEWMHEIRSELRSDSLLMQCSYSKCGILEGTPDIQYLRCTACMTVIYCSQWIPMAAADDVFFFRQYAYSVIASHAPTIDRALESFIQSLDSKGTGTLSDDERSLISRQKLPIIVLRLDQIGIPVIERCMEVVGPWHFAAQSKSYLNNEPIEKILEMWSGPEVNKEALLVVYMIPKSAENPWGFSCLLRFPLGTGIINEAPPAETG